jgi:hypothetical protein
MLPPAHTTLYPLTHHHLGHTILTQKALILVYVFLSSFRSYSTHYHVIQVKVKRAFTFEELQSGAYFNSLDESDLQFFEMYGQPVLIPCPEDSDQGGWSLQGHTHMHLVGDASTPPQYTPPSSFQISKSYTLVDSLGQLSTSQAPSGTRVSAIAPAGHGGVRPMKQHVSLFGQVGCALCLTA